MKINKKLAKLMTENPIKADVSITDNKLYLYGTVGDYWGGITLDDVKYQIKNMEKTNLIVHIHSYGGDATEGVAIRNFLMDSFSNIDVVIDGIAASSASIIAMCGKTLTMPTGTTYMIHNPLAGIIGNRQDLLREAKALESLEQSYRNVYMERFTGTEEELIELMENESWLTAEESEQLGFATTVEENPQEDKTDESTALVASLVGKYAAKATKEDNVAKNKTMADTQDTPPAAQEKPKQNKLLQNFAKMFSDI